MRRGRQRRMMSEINVTPMVDVMLVLLVIFMVTAPMMTQGVDVDLPKTTSRALRQKERPIVISINKRGDIFLNRVRGSEKILRRQLQKLALNDGTKRPVYLKADRRVQYGVVAAVMADIKAAGFNKLGMVTKPRERR
ncbi:MAG TPA: protein TolR [Desulfobacterales bacterium]|uniref:Tol biopolymer transport system, TolR protein n=1 Tax=hydrothermal vent metagenome TaxID=652676 RepID=A0A3B0VUB9_9ZZZZ|nr:protein TolR [Desulfobacterales bacterium]